jgi:hypothetical protein
MSKALGHALEGYITGLVQHLCDKHSKGKRLQYEVRRKLPVALSMNCDIVVWRKIRESESVLANLLVFQLAPDAGSSRKKWKRSRQEYIESELLPRRVEKRKRALFAQDFHTVSVAFCPYGKDSLASQFVPDIPPCLYVPNILTEREESVLCERVLEFYNKQRGDKTGAVALAARESPSSFPHSNKVLKALSSVIWGYRRKRFSSVVDDEYHRLVSARKATRLTNAISTRFCHGFNLLALFSQAERKVLYKLHAFGGALDPSALSQAEQEAILKAIFLGVISLRSEGKNRQYRLIFQTKQLVDDLDVSFVLDRLDLNQVDEVLISLMGYAGKYKTAYAGFISGLRMANCKQLIPIAADFLSSLQSFLATGKGEVGLIELIRDAREVKTPNELWSGDSVPVLAVWTTAVALLVATTGDRTHTKSLEFGRSKSPSEREAKALLQMLRSTPRSNMNRQISECLHWIAAWEKGDWQFMASQQVPAIFDIKSPSSWLQWHYNIIGTHCVFRPINEACYRHLVLKEWPKDAVDGFPKRMAAVVKNNVEGSTCRAQFAMIAKTRDKTTVYDAKCITANNWGNKSKELFDRVGDFKRACHAAGIEGEAVLVIDGDFSNEAIRELASPDAYDRIYSMDELFPLKK